MSELKFSVIIPTFNSSLGIKKTIDSLINQTLEFKENIELIIVDNDSIDDTEHICKEYKQKYPNNIQFIKNKSKIAKNIGIENANGEYIAFLENNNYFSQNTLENVLKFIETNDECDVITIPIYYYKNGRKEHYLDYPIKDTALIDLLKNPEYDQFIWAGSFVKNRSIKQICFLNEYNENITFLNEILINNPKLGICKNGSLHVENIEEKLLPDEEYEFSSYEYDQFVNDNLMNLINKSQKKFFKVPKFIQYALLNHINWLSTIRAI